MRLVFPARLADDFKAYGARWDGWRLRLPGMEYRTILSAAHEMGLNPPDPLEGTRDVSVMPENPAAKEKETPMGDRSAWTAREDTVLRKMYGLGVSPGSGEMLRALPGRNPGSITGRAHRLGLTGGGKAPARQPDLGLRHSWTPVEDKALRELHALGVVPSDPRAQWVFPDRNVNSIKSRCNRLGLFVRDIPEDAKPSDESVRALARRLTEALTETKPKKAEPKPTPKPEPVKETPEPRLTEADYVPPTGSNRRPKGTPQQPFLAPKPKVFEPKPVPEAVKAAVTLDGDRSTVKPVPKPQPKPETADSLFDTLVGAAKKLSDKIGLPVSVNITAGKN